MDDIIIELPGLSMERGTWSSPPQLSCSVRQHFGSQVEHGVWASKLSELTTLNPSQITKSGIMVGLGETFDKVVETMLDLRAVGVDILTVGQYLRPTRQHAPIMWYYTPQEFAEFRRAGLAMGFRWVEFGPLVRSSYNALAYMSCLSPNRT